MESEPQVAASAASDAAHGLRRELGVGSLVLTQILYIVGASWVGVAATVGQAHVVLWIAAVALLAIIGVSLASAIAYALDGYGGFSVENPWHVRLASFAAIAIGATVVSLGLRIGKWVHNVGGAVHVLSFLALIIVPFVAMAHGRQVQYRPLDIAMPAATLFTLNMFTKLAMGAFSGFEYVAILAGECRDPA
jgi:amino acid transporter